MPEDAPDNSHLEGCMDHPAVIGAHTFDLHTPFHVFAREVEGQAYLEFAAFSCSAIQGRNIIIAYQNPSDAIERQMLRPQLESYSIHSFPLSTILACGEVVNAVMSVTEAGHLDGSYLLTYNGEILTGVFTSPEDQYITFINEAGTRIVSPTAQ